jgi:cystathionine beta-lyase/cystathionine gamma-synthase
MGGVVAGDSDLVNKIKRAQNWLGGLMRPMDAFLVTQGVKTLPLRMRQHCQNAQMVAEFLESHPAVARVRYGGLPSWNPQAAGGTPKSFGGMVGIEWKESAVHEKVGKHTKLIINATSLGDPVTRITPRKEEKPRGIPKRYSRLSIGLEEPEDLIADFKQAIAKCA